MSDREQAAPVIPRLSAADLCAALAAGERWLTTNRDGINAINVYPVPDGDTGTNMLLTLRAALRAVEDPPPTVGEATQRIARAALLGARGNSGVILSQMLRGLAEGLAEREDTSGPGLIHALCVASDTAYSAVSAPVEGTMLTVLREASHLARESLAREAGEAAILDALIDEAYESVRRTPTLLPRLADAGVVDAGGAGIAVILEGVVSYIHRVELPDEPRYRADGQVTTAAVEHDGHGYCTEYLVLGSSDRGIDLAAIEAELLAIGGESLLVVGDARTVHVHVHVEDPGPALSIGAQAGALDSVKVENMQTQHETWMAGHEPAAGNEDVAPAIPATPIGLVAIASGEGIARAFRDLGAAVVLQPKDGAKTSAAEILDAARRAGRDGAIVLPNDGDVLMAAEAAAREAPEFITVVPSRNVATGLAAAIYFTSTGDPAEIAEEMSGVLSETRSVEVSTASRDASVDGVAVRSGEPIVLVDGRLRGSATTHEDALLAGLASAVTPSSEIVTVYLGRDAAEGAAAAISPRLMAAHPGLEVEVLPGGQPHYVYLASVE